MPRAKRMCPGGMVFHCLNRSVARLTLFEKDADYEAFERVLEEAFARTPLRILDYVVMPNHWHLMVWPQTDEDVSEFLQWLTVTHTMRWHAHYGTSGTGHLYQGRFKAFPVQSDEHLFQVLRYVERNPVRAGLVSGRRIGGGEVPGDGSTAMQSRSSCWRIGRCVGRGVG